MKKKVFFILAFPAFIISLHCKTQKETLYIVPEQYTGETRQNLIKMLEEGQELFKINCSRCHGIFGQGKDSIPNFSRTQIESYRSSALLDDPGNHAVAQKIRPYDLDMILQFLQFRKPPDTTKAGSIRK
ncbi:MAG TPA: c-type cytochrome [Chitinophagaceae bacterium]|nr:c-type cytochrome [Chitinophagaceae bacterium]